MRRAFPQKVNFVPSCVADHDADAIAAQISQSHLGSSRVRRSAAMIGLAISMGAYSLVAPHQADRAVAADATVAVDSTNVDSVSLPTLSSANIVAGAQTPSKVSISTSVARAARDALAEHTVQPGQTLWRIAQLYKVNVSVLAAANRLESGSTLFVGQVLAVPDANSGDALAQPYFMGRNAPDVQQLAEARPEAAVANMREKQTRLKSSLAELKSDESSGLSAKSRLKEIGLISYRVNAGETLSSIAKAHGVSYAELAKLNSLDDPNLLEADQFIQIPQGEKAAITQPIAAQPPVEAYQSATNLPVVASLAPMPSSAVVSPQVTALVPASQEPSWHGQGSSLPGARPLLSAPPSSKRYVESLTTEIAQLRHKYQAKAARLQSPQPAASSVSSGGSEVNPEFKPQHLAILKAELRTLQQRRGNLAAKAPAQINAAVQRSQPQLVARAAIGSEGYAPLINSAVGKIVSPELPPLGKSDAYLPNGAKFAGYIWPAQGVLTSGYGWRWGRMHKGIDVAGPIGTPIVAAASGVIVTAGWNDGGYGNLVEIEHPDGSVTLYGHNDRVLVQVGQRVDQGQQIAQMGTTGYSTGPHSHFEVHLPGQGAVNPIAYLPGSRS